MPKIHFESYFRFQVNKKIQTYALIICLAIQLSELEYQEKHVLVSEKTAAHVSSNLNVHEEKETEKREPSSFQKSSASSSSVSVKANGGSNNGIGPSGGDDAPSRTIDVFYDPDSFSDPSAKNMDKLPAPTMPPGNNGTKKWVGNNTLLSLIRKSTTEDKETHSLVLRENFTDTVTAVEHDKDLEQNTLQPESEDMAKYHPIIAKIFYRIPSGSKANLSHELNTTSVGDEIKGKRPKDANATYALSETIDLYPFILINKRLRGGRTNVLVVRVNLTLSDSAVNNVTAEGAEIKPTNILNESQDSEKINNTQQESPKSDNRKKRASPDPYVCEDEAPSICLSPYCVNLAARISSNIDNSIDPCNDFYDYACGGWRQRNEAKIVYGQSSWDQFKEISRKNKLFFKHILG